MATSYSDNVNADYLLEKRDTQGRPQVTLEQAQRLSQISQTTSGLPASLMVKATQDNADDGFLDALGTVITKAKDATYGRIKNAIFDQLGVNTETGGLFELALKGSFLGVRAVYEDIIAQPLRSIQLEAQGVDGKEAWKKSAIDPFAYWKAAKARGEKIDLGNALFQSTDPEKTETYRDLIDKGADPIKAREIAISRLGANIFDEIAQKETSLLFDGDRAAKLIARGKSPHITPGRVLFKPLEFIIGPEDKAYDYATGLFDLGLNLLDPTFLFGKAAKGIKASTKLLKISDLTTAQKADLGFLDGFMRKSFSRKEAQSVIDGKLGDAIAEFLYTNRNNPAKILEESNFSLVNKYVIEDKALSKDFSDFTKELFALEEMPLEAGIKAVKDLITPKILATATGGAVPQVQKIGAFRKSLQTYFGALYDTRLNPSNVDNTIVQYTKFLKLLDPTDQVVNRNQKVKELIEGLDELSGKSVNTRATFITNKVKDDFSSLRTVYKEQLAKQGKLVEGDKTDKLVDKVFTSLTRILDEKNEISKDIQRYSKLDKVPLGIKNAWDDLFKRDGEFIEGVNKEVLEQQFDTIFSRPILETTLTQDLFLAKPSEVIKLSNKLIGGFGENFDKATSIVGDRAVGRFLDTYMGSYFKPIVLLRPAWTVRVIAEEQARAIADGALGLLDHPLGLLAKLTDNNTKVRASYAQEGWLDTPAFRAGISESTTGDTRTVQALKRNSVQGDIKYQNIGKKENLKKWKDGQYRVAQTYFNSILAKEIAKVELSKNKTEAVQELLAKLKKKGQLRDAMLSLTSGTHNPYRILRGADGLAPSEYDNVLKTFISTLRKDMQQSLSYNGKNVSRELYQAIENGKFKLNGVDYNLNIASKAGIKQSEFNGLMNGKIKGAEADKLQKKIDVANQEVIEAYAKKFGDTLPDRVDYKVPPYTTNKAAKDRIVESAFRFFMTTPTNQLSRIPVFKSIYWKKSEEMIPIASEAVKQKIIAGAKKANLDKKTIKRMENLKSGGKEGINDPALIEGLAKGAGVEKVKSLLYDITQTRRFWEASRWLFPFGNAWQEVLTTWLGIFKTQPQVLARGATIWDGSTQENDTLDPAGKGFFYKNPINGKVMFNYPGSDIFNNWMFKDSTTETDVRVNLPVYAQSVNIAGTILPGFGPVVQVPAAFLFKNFPEESFINNLLFGEFGVPNLKDQGEVIKSLGFVPAWLDKFRILAFNQGENSQGVFGNTVMDVYKALLYSGQVNDSTEELAKEGMDKAVVGAKRVFLYRAASQLFGPAGVATPIYELTDKNMNYFAFETLADEYRTIKAANNFDDVLATQEFIEKYGINPLPLTVSKTISVEPYPTTVEGADWLKKNKDLYEQYPLVAMYLEPAPTYAEFSFDAYKKALLEGKRVYRQPDQWQVAKNKLLGSVALAEYERSINIIGDNSQEAKALRNAEKKRLEQKYWGYGQPGIVGSPRKPTIEQQIEQLEKMMLDPNVQNYPSIQAAKLYFAERQKIINAFVGAGLSETIWKTSAKYASVRAALRNEAYKIIQDTPQFGPLFDTLLSREIEPEYEDNLLVELGLGK